MWRDCRTWAEGVASRTSNLAAWCGTAARAGVCAAAMAFPLGAQAQDKAPGRSSIAKLVTGACVADYARFCPGAEDRLASGREQALCLKYFKPDLSLGCRRAVTAFFRLNGLAGVF